MFKPGQYHRPGRPGLKPLGERPARTRASAKSAPKSLSRITARVLPKLAYDAPPRGRFFAGSTSFPCAIGAGSVSRRKREGDLASPAGQFRLLGGYFQPTGQRPAAAWPLRIIHEADGWCDDPRAPAYNRPVSLPSRYSCEKLWRNDGLYDLVLILDYNLWPRRQGRGSAIFLHCAREDFAPTAGCIALRKNDLRKLLPRLAKGVVLEVR